MHDYIARNGVSEQTRFYRQQPRKLAALPFDFELEENDRSAMRNEFVVAFVVIVTLLSLWALV